MPRYYLATLCSLLLSSIVFAADADTCVVAAEKARGYALSVSDPLMNGVTSCLEVRKSARETFDSMRPAGCEKIRISDLNSQDAKTLLSHATDSNHQPLQASAPVWDALRETVLQMVDAKCDMRQRARR